MLIKDILPNPSLREVVRKYQIIRWVFNENECPPPKYLAPRPEHSLAFYIRDAQTFSFPDSQKVIKYPKSILSGIHDVAIHRDCGHDFWAIKVIFQPSALYRLTGIPARELVSNFIDAEAIWGKQIREVESRLNSTENLEEMLLIIEDFLEKMLRKNLKNAHPIDAIGQIILNNNQYKSLDVLAEKSCLSVRQFIRKFEERVGVSPKMFDRITRFDRAYRMKNSQPNLDWLSLALACNYYDYQHLAKDFKDFTKLTPVSFYEIEQKAPERTFGMHFE